MAILKAINIGLSFLLEMAMLGAFAYWGLHVVANPWLRWVLAIGAPLVVIILWGLFLAPKAGHRFAGNIGVPLSLVLFSLGALAFFSSNQPVLGIAMVVLAVLNRTLAVVWKQW